MFVKDVPAVYVKDTLPVLLWIDRVTLAAVTVVCLSVSQSINILTCVKKLTEPT